MCALYWVFEVPFRSSLNGRWLSVVLANAPPKQWNGQEGRRCGPRLKRLAPQGFLTSYFGSYG